MKQRTVEGTVLVTGAAGTVGSYVVGLLEAEGRRVVATDIHRGALPTPVRGEARVGDLSDERFVREVVRGCRAIVHTASLLDASAAPGALARINTEAVVRLFEAAAAEGVERFVHVSTATLYGRKQTMPLREDAVVEPRGAFGLSKLGAETFLRGHAPGSGPAWTILRPAPLYGRRGKHFAASLLSIGPMLRVGTPLLPRPKGGPRGTMVHAEDVARAAIFALDHDATKHEIYNVSDGDALTLGERLAETFRAYGLRMVPTGKLPEPVLRWVARTFDAPGARETADVWALAAWRVVVVRHRLKAALRPRLDKEALTFLDDDFVVDASKLKSLGWAPRFPKFSEGFADVLRWYQAERWVPRYA